jgi:hypothetical protein
MDAVRASANPSGKPIDRKQHKSNYIESAWRSASNRGPVISRPCFAAQGRFGLPNLPVPVFLRHSADFLEERCKIASVAQGRQKYC